eukprot:351624-Chlamydomonas_euryale.AAC.2
MHDFPEWAWAQLRGLARAGHGRHVLSAAKNRIVARDEVARRGTAGQKRATVEGRGAAACVTL